MKNLLMLITLSACGLHAADAPNASFHVDVTGQGKPMILIPGLASSGHVWDSTVAHYKDHYRCYVLTLAGFAGQPAISGPMVETVRKDLATYIRTNKLDRPIIVGHSLGGFLALWLASEEPELTGPIVIVDAYPFLGAMFQEGATKETILPMADGLRKGMANSSRDQYDKQAAASVTTMVTSPDNVALVTAWGKASDQKTAADAMFTIVSTDLRQDISKINVPVLVINTFIGYPGVTHEAIEATQKSQYAQLKGVQFAIDDKARHFVMLDDPQGFFQWTDKFLAGK